MATVITFPSATFIDIRTVMYDLVLLYLRFVQSSLLMFKLDDPQKFIYGLVYAD